MYQNLLPHYILTGVVGPRPHMFHANSHRQGTSTMKAIAAHCEKHAQYLFRVGCQGVGFTGLPVW